MKLDKLVLKDILRFRGRVELDFRALPPGLIAFVGPNGHGKTSLMETPPGVIFRILPSRRRDGTDPVQYANSRDAVLEMDWTADAGGRYRARVNMDGQTKKSDAVCSLLVDGEWRPLNDGKVSTFKTAMAPLFPSFDLFLASAFAAQGKGAKFCSLAQSERQELFAEFLGLQQYAAWAKTARFAAAAVVATRDRLLAGLTVLGDQTAPAAVAALALREADLAATKTAAHDAQRTLRAAIDDLKAQLATGGDDQAALAAAQATHTRLTKQLGDAQMDRLLAADALTKEQARATQERQALERERDLALKDIETRTAGNAQLLAQRAAIRAAVDAIAAIDLQLVEARKTHPRVYEAEV
jgi:DNA repair exonuclease SbcCD ATPase subunit